MVLVKELGYAIRGLLREPRFAVFCVLMLGVGIAANTAIFSIVNGVLLEALPYREPARLVTLGEVIPAVAATYPTLPVSARHFTEWRQRSSSFESLTAMSTGTSNLTGVAEPERIQSARVSASFFETLGVGPQLGRGFLPGEDSEGQDRVVVISDSLWKRRFQADPAILGKTITLDDVPCLVVGILPPRFQFPAVALFESGPTLAEKPELLRPLVFSKGELNELMGTFNYPVVARLKDGVSPEAALADLNVLAAQLEKASGETVDLKASVRSLRESMVGGSRRGLIVLFCAVGAVLLIACVNLANVMLARAERKGREWAIRSALGASRASLLRQVLAETVVLALLGGALGVILAAGSLGELLRHVPADIPRLSDVRLDTRVLLFALGLTLATGLLSGLVPALRLTRDDPQSALRSKGRTSTSERRGARFRDGLVGAEVGLSAVLLILAALLGGSFIRVMRNDKGFRAPTVLAADIAIPLSKYQEDEQRIRFHQQVLDRLQSQPGVVTAALSTAVPLTGETWVDSAWVPGDPRPEVERPIVNVRFVSEDYLETMGIPLIAGRSFTQHDRGRKVAILSERIAKLLWPGRVAVGRRFARGDDDFYEVIGVAGDVRTDPDQPPVAIVYRPYWEWAPRRVVLVARAAAEPGSIAPAVRSVIRSVDPDVPVPEMRTMHEILEESVAQRRFQMLLSASFAAAALLLAALGTYGVVSYAVALRTNEMGIRMALGASPSALRRMVLKQAMVPVVAGLTLGTITALLAGRLVRSMLYDVSPNDPAIITAVILLLAGVGLAGAWSPAERAVRVNPLAVLHDE
jgi:predicted permease